MACQKLIPILTFRCFLTCTLKMSTFTGFGQLFVGLGEADWPNGALCGRPDDGVGVAPTVSSGLLNEYSNFVACAARGAR